MRAFHGEVEVGERSSASLVELHCGHLYGHRDGHFLEFFNRILINLIFLSREETLEQFKALKLLLL